LSEEAMELAASGVEGALLVFRAVVDRELSASLSRWDRGVKFLKFCVGADAQA
jgi:hypothetical protein